MGIHYEVIKGRGTETFGELSQRLARKTVHRTALVCPEDNFAVALLASLREAGVSVPDDVGLLAGMGTEILERAGISRLSVDFVDLGRRAVTTRAKDWTENLTVPFALVKDRTT